MNVQLEILRNQQAIIGLLGIILGATAGARLSQSTLLEAKSALETRGAATDAVIEKLGNEFSK